MPRPALSPISPTVHEGNRYDYLVSENIAVAVNEATISGTTRQKTAVVSLLVRAKGQRAATGPFEGVFRNVRLFVHEEGVWRCRVWLNTRIGPSEIPPA